MNTAEQESATKIFNLYGSTSTGNYTAVEDIKSALPANLETINFARLKITDTLQDWATKSKEKPTDVNNERPKLESLTALTRNEILNFVYTSILSKHAIANDHLETLETPNADDEDDNESPRASKETRVSQGADLLLFIQAGTQAEQLGIATKIVAATQPLGWPAESIANQILVIRDILFDIPDEPDYDPEEGRMFFDEDELEGFLAVIQKTCCNTIGSEIKSIIERFCTARPKGSSGSPPKAVADWEMQVASELLSFVAPDGKDICCLILQALGTYSMPLEGVEQAVLQIIATSRPKFIDQVKSDVHKHVKTRKIPLPFPLKRSKSRSFAEGSQSQRDEGSNDEVNKPKSVSFAPESQLQCNEVENLEVKEEAQDVTFGLIQLLMQEDVPPSIPNPNSAMLFQPAHASASMANQRVTSGGAPQRTAQGSASAPIAAGQAPSFTLPTRAASANQAGGVSYLPQILNVGKGPTKFSWWNIATSLPVDIDKQFSLSINPKAGDVVSLYDARSLTAAVFYHSGDEWVDASDSFFRNYGLTVYPSDGEKRVLTWKSKDLRIPTRVMANTYKKSKQFRKPGMGGMMHFFFKSGIAVAVLAPNVNEHPTKDRHRSPIPTLRPPEIERRGLMDFDHLLHQILSQQGFLNYVHLYQSWMLQGDHPPAGSRVIVTRISHDQGTVPHTEPGFIGTQSRSEKVPPLAELFKQGYCLIEYEGPHIFIDKEDQVVIGHLPFPDELIDAGLNNAFVEAMQRAQSQLSFSSANTTNGDDCNRGDFRTISTGILHRGGQTLAFKEPQNLAHISSNASILTELVQSKAVQCIATWQNNCYKQWMPLLAQKSKETLDHLLCWKPTLQRMFSNTVFASTTYNFGPNIICDFHYNHLNWAPGICAMTLGGTYDHKKGGHMVLKEPKLVLEFPACSTMLLPSAAVMHENSPIQAGEFCISMTQYTAGGLVRWVEYGFRSSKEYEASRSNSRSSSTDGANRWAEYLDLYSKYSDFSTLPDPS